MKIKLYTDASGFSALAEEWNSEDIDYAELQKNFIDLAAGRIAGEKASQFIMEE